MLKFGNKEFNNLQEQVLENANDILEIKQGLGTALPNPVAGPQGPQGLRGPQGVQGTRGSAWTVGTDLPASANLGDIHLLWNGDVYQYTNQGWELKLNIRGGQGVEGKRGFTGPQGIRGPQGIQGPQGVAAPIYKVVGQLTSIEELPDPTTVATNEAYIVGNDIYGIVANEWVNLGPKLVISDAASIVSTEAGLLTANNVQDAITQLSQAEYISLGLDDLGNSVYDGVSALNNRVNDARQLATNALQGNPKVLELNGDNFALGSFTDVGYSTSQIAEFDILKVTLTAEKQLTPNISLHTGTYLFRKTGYREVSNASLVDHVVFEMAYNAYTHSFNGRDVSIYIESYSDNGVFMGFRVAPDDDTVVHKIGNESIAGVKTFSNINIQSNAYDNIASISTGTNTIAISAEGDTSGNSLILKTDSGQVQAKSVSTQSVVPLTGTFGVLGSYNNKWDTVYVTNISDGTNFITVTDVKTLQTDVGNIGTILDQVNGEVL